MMPVNNVKRQHMSSTMNSSLHKTPPLKIHKISYSRQLKTPRPITIHYPAPLLHINNIKTPFSQPQSSRILEYTYPIHITRALLQYLHPFSSFSPFSPFPTFSHPVPFPTPPSSAPSLFPSRPLYVAPIPFLSCPSPPPYPSLPSPPSFPALSPPPFPSPPSPTNISSQSVNPTISSAPPLLPTHKPTKPTRSLYHITSYHTLRTQIHP